MKLGPVSVGALANGEEFGVVSLRLRVIAGQLDGLEKSSLKCGSGTPLTLVCSTFPVGVARHSAQ